MDALSIFFYVLLFTALYAQVFLLISLIEMGATRAKEKKAAEGAKANGTPLYFPTVTVLVPCYNEEETIAPTIDSLLALDYPLEKLRILVINDGSTDGTAKAMAPYVGKGTVDLITKENGGKHTAMNVGIKETTSDLIAVLDADSFVASDALKNLVRAFDDASVSAATSFIYVHKPKRLIERIQSAEYVVSGLLRDIMGHLNAQFVTPGPFSIYRREVFTEVGGFRYGHLTEDLEMALRMQQHGMRIVNVSTSRVATVPPSTFGALLKQRIRWHYGFLNNAYEYRRMFFRPKYGHLGFFSLPAGVISIFTAIILTANLIKDSIVTGVNKIIELSIVGIDFSVPSFNLFFVRTGTYNLMLVTVMTIFICIIIAARRLMPDRKGLILNTLYFFFAYGMVAPIWYSFALYRTFFARQVRWK